ncbi:uncharacterized protein MELLADRAFT_87649 [Melampsora larici-populina 98AG31]|uniref:Alkyl transferase n=1 Tax=Melampsora larici-populina (strain 98AG31 / pathotype 3-4-7) TaxID=747676 RepID=F4RP71_MELLP|nr:uncharacterized protein MELLADRAFT_87649 [Melampsora larici-populina 98AG31]EGG05767.1 hypothetical protein MELLADRAFT_87649 [Melampsora larici-populina 98AG31]
MIPASFYPTLRTLVIQTLKQGPTPRHVGFIMDGNRRFSRTNGVPVEEGHMAGFEALKRVLELLLRLEVPNVTVYAFAIDNFNRPAHEVSKLMDMARTKLIEICERGQLLDRYGIRVVVIGRKDLLPADIQNSVAKVESMTAHNTRGCLNVAFPYSSQEEMATALCRTVQDSISQNQPTSMIDIETIGKHIYTSHSPPLDILVRTSGVRRLSDFLLWQTTLDTMKTSSKIEALGPSVHFVDRYWPDFGILDVLPIILGWQAEELFKRGMGFA